MVVALLLWLWLLGVLAVSARRDENGRFQYSFVEFGDFDTFARSKIIDHYGRYICILLVSFTREGNRFTP